ncbi:MAG TPA: hypothetical protein VNJ02_01330 [Vicinamibacterales bacterium]|nr:hypothetical protein [Vicinamibacterales bacterium]
MKKRLAQNTATPSANVARRVIPIAVGVIASALTIVSGDLLDDHFGRITLGYQWLTYGDRPFRDFFDPGLFGAAAWSAIAFVATGGSLAGEVWFDSIAIGTGLAITCALATRATNSSSWGVFAASLSFACGIRLYDFDKVLSYPAGLWACWHYADRPSTQRAALGGLCIAAAALLRYDTAVYLGAAWAVTLLAVHRTAWRTLFSSALISVAAGVALAGPVVYWIHSLVGLPEAIDQVLTYARIERSRSELFDWAPLLREGSASEAWFSIMRRGRATGSVYLALAMLVPLALATAWQMRGRFAPGSVASAHRLAAATLLGLLVVFILRDPLPARLGSVLPIGAVVAACVLGPTRPSRKSVAMLVAVVACMVAGVVSTAGEIDQRLRSTGIDRGPQAFWAATKWRVSNLASVPPALGLMPGGDRSRNLAWYLRRCTAPTDSVMITWFGPQIYYFAQRRFGGGAWAFFGDHWASTDRQSQVIARLRQRPPSVVIRDRDREQEFLSSYPQIADYLNRTYRVGGVTDFDLRQHRQFTILVPAGSDWTSKELVWGLPCRGRL